ncbi:LysR family transcriptional regulator [Aliiglaciecola sp. LCG003]|uniref:LysR family transcriptional regulator n=1 Tax=Aliiglaciecola sp. LCG003 TaxID=3053655 RepID=UPI00257282DA|nr:LysR family transcriptional regulator [Aliiglaciecola sp. LCG003]WJG08165.1 LysR family transcriptional regulator [Aliiglaciecola sp. LCG003]
MINPTWLNTFCTLVDVGHFTQTATKLFMTQSGVSQHIKKLENQLASQLLIRQGKSFSLTSAGQQLYTKGRELLHSAAELEASIKQDDAYSGRVKIASPGSIGLNLYPRLLTLQLTHPALSIDYRFAPNKSIEQDLNSRELDLGLITELTDSSSLVSQKIGEEPLVLVTSNKVNSIDWGALVKIGFISHPDAAHHGRLLLSKNFGQFEHIEQFPYRGFSNQISLILEPVSMGLGFTVLPLHAAQAFKPQKTINIHRLEKAISENLYLCFNRHAILANRVKFIRSMIIDYLAQPLLPSNKLDGDDN